MRALGRPGRTADRPLALADAVIAPLPVTRAPQTFSFTITLPPRVTAATVDLPSVPCAVPGESFLVSSVVVGPDASVRESDEITGRWALGVAIGQQIGDSEVRETSLALAGERVTVARAELPGGQPLLRALRLRLLGDAGHASAVPFLVHLSGSCGVPSKLPSAPVVVAAPPAPKRVAQSPAPQGPPPLPNLSTFDPVY